jgi:serine phosphatase RsbU (regulator of sigma subunit)
MEPNIDRNNADILIQSTELLQKPSKNTKRKILISVNLIFILMTSVHLITQLVQFGKLPDPARDMVLYPMLLAINLISAIYNLYVILKEINGSGFWNTFTAWSTVIILMVLALATVHANPNTGTSILFDFALSIIIVFICGTVLNRNVAVVWLVISIISLYMAHYNRGADFQYQFLTKQETKDFNQKLQQKDPQAIARLDTLNKEKIAPLPLSLFFSIAVIYLLLAFFAVFFEGGMIGQILKVIPTVISNIHIASEQKNKLEKENMRMGMELDVAKRIQTMVLPHVDEFSKCKDLEVAARMDTATEVGGDFYDVLPQKDGSTYFGIGDVTDHGLQSGIVMLMTQSAFRTVLDGKNDKITNALTQINNVLFQNIQTRLSDKRNLTLSILKYADGKINITGQHETILHLKAQDSKVTEIKTLDLGMYVGLTEEFSGFVHEEIIDFKTGDILLLYTDGATEAENPQKEFYGSEKLKSALEKYRNFSCNEIINKITEEIYTFMENKNLLDDITFVAIKRAFEN